MRQIHLFDCEFCDPASPYRTNMRLAVFVLLIWNKIFVIMVFIFITTIGFGFRFSV